MKTNINLNRLCNSFTEIDNSTKVVTKSLESLLEMLRCESNNYRKLHNLKMHRNRAYIKEYKNRKKERHD